MGRESTSALGEAFLTTWLTNRAQEPAELTNLPPRHPDKVREMQRALRQKLYECQAPYELLDRFQLSGAR